MSQTDSDFVATGPTLKAFETAVNEPHRITFGVNVRGNQCGVYGESVRRSRRNPPPPFSTENGIGVCGVGDRVGVMGEGGSIAGVFGQIEEGGSTAAGIIGIGQSFDITGVLGLSTEPSKRKRSQGNGVGVLGASDNGKGSGILGLSIKDTKNEAVPVHKNTKPDGNGIGVMGASGTGTGVAGISESGEGVTGSSKRGRGGLFQSGKNVAQIHLVPQKQRRARVPKLPQEGKVGDLIMIRSSAPYAETVSGADICTLWLCVPKDTTNFSDQWQQVLLGPRVTGTE